MNHEVILLIVLLVALIAISVIGFLVKRYTKRKLQDIDGACGITTKEKGKGNVISVEQSDDKRIKPKK